MRSLTRAINIYAKITEDDFEELEYDWKSDENKAAAYSLEELLSAEYSSELEKWAEIESYFKTAVAHGLSGWSIYLDDVIMAKRAVAKNAPNYEEIVENTMTTINEMLEKIND